jgi:hypothetical protein
MTMAGHMTLSKIHDFYLYNLKFVLLIRIKNDRSLSLLCDLMCGNRGDAALHQAYDEPLGTRSIRPIPT